MMKQRFLMRYGILLAGVAIILWGCDDSCTVSNPETVEQYDTVLVDNGFIGEWQDGTTEWTRTYGFDAETSSAILLNNTEGSEEIGTTMVLMADVLRFPGETQTVFVEIRLPDTVAGGYPWQNLLEQDRSESDSYITIRIDGNQYVGVDGTTQLVSYRNIATNKVSGTFAGEFLTEFGGRMTVKNGRFNAGIPK